MQRALRLLHQDLHPAALHPQGQGRGFGLQGPPPTPPSSGMSKDQRRNAKAMAKLDKQVEAEKPRVYRPLGEEDRLEAARSANWPTVTPKWLFILVWHLLVCPGCVSLKACMHLTHTFSSLQQQSAHLCAANVVC